MSSFSNKFVQVLLLVQIIALKMQMTIGVISDLNFNSEGGIEEGTNMTNKHSIKYLLKQF